MKDNFSMYSARAKAEKDSKPRRRSCEQDLYNASVVLGHSENYYNLEKVKSEPTLTEKNKLIDMYKWDQVMDFIDEDDNIVVSDAIKTAAASSVLPILDTSLSFHLADVLEPAKENLADENMVTAKDKVHFKKFNDTTMDETLDWRQQVSDDSFVQMEKLIMSEINQEYDAEKDIQHIERENNLGALLKSDLPVIQESFINSSQDVSDAPKSSSFDDSLNFNDTLEEMEHLMKYGMEYILNNPKKEVVEEKPPVVEPDTDSDSKLEEEEEEVTEKKLSVDRLTYLRSEIPIRPVQKSSPLCKISLSTNTKNYLHLNKESVKSPKPNFKPAINTTPFKTPAKLTPCYTTEKRVFFPTPPSIKNKNTTPSKYSNILSPVQYYINNSPVVPKIKNVSPGKNFWMREYERSVAKSGIVSTPQGKENSPLQKRAYKAATSTKLVSTPPSQWLPKNSKVGLMAESLPKPTVIKHKRREFFPSPPKITIDNLHSIDDSFANLKLHTGDVSVCVGKEAVRSNTLK